MGEHGYIYVKNWSDFQHYKDQTTPAWIKSYRRLLSDDKYLALSQADRGLLHDLWLLCANDGEGRVSANPKLLARRLNVRRVSLEPLIQAGFLTIRSRKRLDKPYRSSRTETEAETEKKSVPAGDDPPVVADAAILSINTERVMALDALLVAIGDDADKNTATTINRIIAARRLSTGDIQLARERVVEARCDNRARYAVGVLQKIEKAG